jgi:hypothetical protein
MAAAVMEVKASMEFPLSGANVKRRVGA